MLKILKVNGESLSPELKPGDYVVVSNRFWMPCAGDVIVFQHKRYGTMIKKLYHISRSGSDYFVIGAHRNSIDSRHFGMIEKAAVIGRVVWLIRGKT